MGRNIINREKEENYNSFGSLMVIVRYRHSKDLDIYFPEYNWTYYNAAYKEFKNGHVKCPFEPRYFGVGYLGEGEFKTTDDDGNELRSIITWSGMLQRCYGRYSEINKPSYEDCEVCAEWLNYQNFAKWYYENYYEIPGERMMLDKDILIKGNKLYSPDTCVFVPIKINSLFTKCDKTRGELPIGVSYYNKKFIAQCHDGNGNNKKIGRYSTIEQAFDAYKTYKEKIIKRIADNYKKYIPVKLYKAMYDYNVEMDD